MSRHRAPARPRYGRIAVLVASVVVTGVATLGGIGVLPSSADDTDRAASTYAADATGGDREATVESGGSEQPAQAASSAPDNSTAEFSAADAFAAAAARAVESEKALPAASGEGRRVVFSQSRQRVWLVGKGDDVAKTYLVSGSNEDNLDPGTYEVYSRSEDAIGIDDSGTMKFFVRFTQGPSGAAIGFHDIPIKDDRLVQRKSQLGTPLSHGCIRQKRGDAVAMWDYAPLGTKVVVTA